jgi:uncharacterized membrane protein
MSIAPLAPMAITHTTSRWLLLGSLALNLFFIGVALAMALRGPAPSSSDRDVFVRVERLATTLPPADAALFRAAIDGSREKVQVAQTQYRGAQDEIRQALRHDPFDIESMRIAMTETRAARQNFDQIVQGVFLSVAPKMSSSGRQALANWPPDRNTSSAR